MCNGFILNLSFHWCTSHITKNTYENEKHLELYKNTINNNLLKIQKLVRRSFTVDGNKHTHTHTYTYTHTHIYTHTNVAMFEQLLENRDN